MREKILIKAGFLKLSTRVMAPLMFSEVSAAHVHRVGRGVEGCVL